MLNWAHFPRSAKPTPLALQVVEAFEAVLSEIDSANHTLPSNGVLRHVAPLAAVPASTPSGMNELGVALSNQMIRSLATLGQYVVPLVLLVGVGLSA